MEHLSTDELQQIRSLQTQNIAVCSLIIASTLSIKINNAQIDMIINRENSQYTKEYTDKLGKISNIIIWITAIYFTILTIEAYNKEKTKTNASFLSAAILALEASSIRLSTILKYPNTDISSDDIL